MVAWLLVYCSRIDWQLQAELAVARSGSLGTKAENSHREPQVNENAEGEDAPLIAQRGSSAE